MPCLLKRPTPASPGIVTLTSNEAIRGPAATSERVRELLVRMSDAGEWIFGSHVQGDFSNDRWPRLPCSWGQLTGLRTYPTPRTVWISGSRPESIFLRR